MLKRAAEEQNAPSVPFAKRRSVEIDPRLRGAAEWRRSEEQHAISTSSARPSSAAAVDAFGLTTDDWSCAHELNALFELNAPFFPSIAVRSRTTFTRADRASVAARVAASPTAFAATGGSGQQQRHKQHLALAAHVLSVAFAPFPTAALSLYEIEVPDWLAGWAGKWCSAASVAGLAPVTPQLGSRSTSPSSSYDSDESGIASFPCSGTTIKLMALHGYAEGQRACGQGAGLGEPQQLSGGGGGGRPARTVFLPIW